MVWIKIGVNVLSAPLVSVILYKFTGLGTVASLFLGGVVAVALFCWFTGSDWL